MAPLQTRSDWTDKLQQAMQSKAPRLTSFLSYTRMILLPVSHITLAPACYRLDLWIRRFVLLHLDEAPADTKP